jgi:hypothetical protein
MYLAFVFGGPGLMTGRHERHTKRLGVAFTFNQSVIG